MHRNIREIDHSTLLRLIYLGNVFYGNIVGNIDMRQSLLTCLGHLGRCERDRIISIYVVLSKVAKASTSVLLSPVFAAGIVMPPLPM
jgi:hypothetical protein